MRAKPSMAARLSHHGRLRALSPSRMADRQSRVRRENASEVGKVLPWRRGYGRFRALAESGGPLPGGGAPHVGEVGKVLS